MKARWLLGALGVALALAAGSGCRGGPGEPRSAEQERPPAPDFTLPDLAGKDVSLHDFRGRVVLVDFWATWCLPCLRQIPVLNRIQATHPSEEVIVLGVSVDAGGRETVLPFVVDHGIHYRVLLGNEALARRYGAPGFPALAVVDPEGRIESLHVGVATPEELEAAIVRATRHPPTRRAAAGAAAATAFSSRWNGGSKNGTWSRIAPASRSRARTPRTPSPGSGGPTNATSAPVK